MHVEGARRLAVVGMEPFGCIPLIKALRGTAECDDVYNKVALTFNTKIKTLMATLKPSLGIINFYTDIYSLILDTVQNPRKYGQFLCSNYFACLTRSTKYNIVIKLVVYLFLARITNFEKKKNLYQNQNFMLIQ